MLTSNCPAELSPDLPKIILSPQQTSSASLLDFVFGLLGEVLGSHDNGQFRQMTSSEQFVVTLEMETSLISVLTWIHAGHISNGIRKAFATLEMQLYGCFQTARRLKGYHHWKTEQIDQELDGRILTNFTRSTTGAFPLFWSFSHSSRTLSPTSDHNLSKLMVGQNLCWRRKWKFLIPTLPKYPGWYLSKLILWWCIPPALPRPPGCLRCLPESNVPWLV